MNAIKWYFVFLVLLWGCNAKEEVFVNCIDEYLEQNDMVRYEGREMNCKFFLKLYEYEGKQYFVLGNICYDMAVYPTDCEGNRLCENGEDEECRQFFKTADFIEIIGVER